MSKINPDNERIQETRDCLRYLKDARGKSGATIDAVRKALERFEHYTGARDFKTFRREQAIGFKEQLAETTAVRTGGTLSYTTQVGTLAALKDFFAWLAWQPGFKSKMHVPDMFSVPQRRGGSIKPPNCATSPASNRFGPWSPPCRPAPSSNAGIGRWWPSRSLRVSATALWPRSASAMSTLERARRLSARNQTGWRPSLQEHRHVFLPDRRRLRTDRSRLDSGASRGSSLRSERSGLPPGQRWRRAIRGNSAPRASSPGTGQMRRRSGLSSGMRSRPPAFPTFRPTHSATRSCI